jgi:Carboxypeptidase regulatory-like domain/TonB dependent receptor-like, beta-barrel
MQVHQDYNLCALIRAEETMMENRNRSGQVSSGFYAVIFLVLLIAIPALAQLPTGTILGTVKDPSGAAVPGATVAIKNVNTGSTRTVTTAADGTYDVPELPVGNYQVQVSRTGFKTSTHSGITLTVTQQAVINFTLEVGSTQQTVVVTGQALVVNAVDATLGGLVSSHSIENLPLNGRNYTDLSLLQPGVTQVRGDLSAGALQVGTSFSANGAPVRSNNFMLDGAVLQNLSSRNPDSLSASALGVDGIQEYKVITSNFQAEYGLTMGSQTVAVSKSGTNQFHGDAYDYLRNSALDARNFFDYNYQLPGGRRTPEFQRNDFGGSFGGPIKKDNTFFYAVYEGIRMNRGVAFNIRVPGAGCHGAANAIITVAECPDIAPLSSVQISPYTAPILAVMNGPSSFSPGGPGVLASYAYSAPSHDSEDYGQMRVDHNFSASDMLFARYTISNGSFTSAKNNEQLNGFGDSYPQFGELGDTRNQWITVAENHIFTSALLNTVRLSFSRTHTGEVDVFKNLPNNNLGPSILPGLPVGEIAIGGGYSTFGPAGAYPSIFYLQNVYTLSDDLSWTRGKHSFKFGMLLNRWNAAPSTAISPEGFLIFEDFAHFLQSQPFLIEYGTPGSTDNRFFRYNTYGFYGQDQWRAASRLTLNLGLRYEFMNTPNEMNGRESRVLNDFTDPFTPGPVLANNTLRDFSPRIGLAYDVFGNGKTALRAGFGIYYDIGNIGTSLQQDSISTPVNGIFGLTDILPAFLPPPSLYPIPLPLNSPVTSCGPPGSFTLTDANIYNSCSTAFQTPQFVDYNSKSPYMIQYNLSIEQQLPFRIGLTLAYVGNRGVHLFTIRDSNPIFPTSTGPCGDPASTCVNGQVPFWDTGSTNYVNVNPNMPSTINIATAADSYYNSLQVIFAKQVSQGLEFTSAFTYSKLIDDTQGQANVADCFGSSGGLLGTYPLDLKAVDKGPSCFNTPYNWEFNMTYHFPTISGSGFLSKLANGWWIGSIVSLQGGYPFSVQVNTNRSNSGVLQGQLDRVDTNTPTLLKEYGCSPPACPFIPYDPNTVITGNINQWFNPYMFSMAPEFVSPSGGGNFVGQLGTSSRDFLLGPNTRNWDFTIAKDTKTGFLGEAGQIEFRAEFFNILNHPNFAMPNTVAFDGLTSDLGPFSEAPSPGAGQITSTLPGNEREIQLVLKLLF